MNDNFKNHLIHLNNIVSFLEGDDVEMKSLVTILQRSGIDSVGMLKDFGGCTVALLQGIVYDDGSSISFTKDSGERYRMDKSYVSKNIDAVNDALSDLDMYSFFTMELSLLSTLRTYLATDPTMAATICEYGVGDNTLLKLIRESADYIESVSQNRNAA